MAVLDIQRRGQQIGRIRIGQQVQTSNGKMRPDRLESFRFTTGSRPAADAIAALFGGEVREWNGEFEVITHESAIGVTVPPRDEVVSQHYEMWNRGGVMRRCDSQTEQLSGGPCLCPHAQNPDDPDEVARCALERSQLASQNPPKACKLVTRINVMIPDLPGLGVWRLDTGSYYAAVEIGDSAHLMQMARDRGVFLPAQLRIEQRQRVAGGTTKKYPVPVLEVLATFRDLATGAIDSKGMAAQLPPPPGQPLAITAGTPPANGTPAAEPPAAKAEPAEPPPTAQEVADFALSAQTRGRVEELQAVAKAAGLLDDSVCTSMAGEPDTFESLRDYLRARWQELPAPPRARQRRASGSPEEAYAARPAAPPAEDDGGSLFDDPNWAEASR